LLSKHDLMQSQEKKVNSIFCFDSHICCVIVRNLIFFN
jgi:hypothetical protein